MVSRKPPEIEVALARARERGRIHALAVFNEPDCLRLDEAAAYARCEPAVIDAARRRGELYAIVSPTDAHELRFPRWQLDAPADRLAAVLLPFVLARTHSLVIHQFMLDMHAQVSPGALTPAQLIMDADADLEPVIRMASCYLDAEQGAS
jgi:hypothetical protein